MLHDHALRWFYTATKPTNAYKCLSLSYIVCICCGTWHVKFHIMIGKIHKYEICIWICYTHKLTNVDSVMKVTNKMQLYTLIYYSWSALYVSSDVFAHHQERLTVVTVSDSIHPSCCQLVSWMSWKCLQFQLIRDTSQQQLGWILPDTVNTVKCSWWWAKTSPETWRTH
jgi:hypothetical protein